MEGLMSNSSLISYTRISPNKSINRDHKIDTITIHCTAGQCTVESLGEIFASPSAEASSNYGVAMDGKIGMYVEEKDRSWCSSSRSNDNRAVTIEVSSDHYHPYAVNEKAYNSLIVLLADICKRNNIKKLLWKADERLIGDISKQNMTVHRWFANKACPGDYLYNKHYEIADAVNKMLGSSDQIEIENDVDSLPYQVRVSVPNLNIRSGPGTENSPTGTMEPGVYTIVEEQNGTGASKWGKLKSGAGWISLDYTEKVR